MDNNRHPLVAQLPGMLADTITLNLIEYTIRDIEMNQIAMRDNYYLEESRRQLMLYKREVEDILDRGRNSNDFWNRNYRA